jgi:hypothetical protein
METISTQEVCSRLWSLGECVEVAFYCVGVIGVGRVRRVFTRFKRKVLKLMRTDCSQPNQRILSSMFNKHIRQREESFIINHFKRLLLNFIVNNNIFFRAITTPSFKKLLDYLN